MDTTNSTMLSLCCKKKIKSKIVTKISFKAKTKLWHLITVSPHPPAKHNSVFGMLSMSSSKLGMVSCTLFSVPPPPPPSAPPSVQTLLMRLGRRRRGTPLDSPLIGARSGVIYDRRVSHLVVSLSRNSLEVRYREVYEPSLCPIARLRLN